MKNTAILLLFTLCSVVSYSQQTVVLVRASDGSSEVYNNLPDAYAAAIDNDALYLSPGSFNTITIQKRLNIFGAGHNPNNPGGVTEMVGINFYNGSDYTKITGIKFTSTVNIGNSDEGANFITIERCKFNATVLVGRNAAIVTNFIFKENIFVGNVQQFWSKSSGIKYENCIFMGELNQIVGATLDNNLFYGYIATSSNGSTYNNNIFVRNPAFVNSSINEYYNNIFVYEIEFPYYSNTGENNCYVPQESIFIGGDPGESFDYSFDYTLLTTVEALLGTDGGEIGPKYGKTDGLKANYAPETPMITQKQIGTTLNEQGQLEVTITVEAQDR